MNHDFSWIPIYPSEDNHLIRSDLKINAPWDQHEQEADRVAEQVSKMATPVWPIEPSAKQALTRKSRHENILGNRLTMLKPLRLATRLQAKEASTTNSGVSTKLGTHIDIVNNAGKPLPEGVRASFEPKFGYDFSKVKIHTHTRAAETAQRMNALAYTIGPEIVFAPGQFVPQSYKGKKLLAHELTHVIQQSQAGGAWQQRKGGTVGGFFANLFRTWDYSPESISEYLEELHRTDDIIDDHDSDDIARQIAEQWAQDTSALDLNVRLRVLLIKEMLSGWVLPGDQEGILNVLEASNNQDLKQIVGDGAKQVSYEEIHSEFGHHQERLEFFNREILSRLGELNPPPNDAQSLIDTLETSETEYGIHVDSVSMSFHWAPGSLYQSFLANVDVPEGGSSVTINLSREKLSISIDPGLIIDIIGPVNTDLTGVEFGFQGLQGDLQLSNFSDLASEQLTEYIQVILRGTRFADPAYDFTRDPNLMAEIKDNSIIGDIRRIQYNLQKDDPPEVDARDSNEDSVDTEAVLEGMSHIGGRVKVTNLLPRRYPEGDGWGVEIPEGSTFEFSLDLDNQALELMNRNPRLERLLIKMEAFYIVKDDVRVFSLSRMEIKRGMEFDLQGFEALTDVKPYILDELPESWREDAGGFMDAIDDLGEFFGEYSGNQSATASGVENLAEMAMSLSTPFLLGYFKQTLMDYSGMSDAQINEFFYDR